MGSQAGSCESQLDGNQIIKWVILQSDCGNLIGRGGEGIKKINELSGSWVKVAHLEDSVRGAKERLVYIRGTPEQNLVALQIIIEKVGGWPFTTPVYDHEIAKIEDKSTLYIPFLAIPNVLFEMRNYHGSLFPSKNHPHPVIAGATVMIDANFFTSSAETQVHLIGPQHSRELAKDVILDRLREWLSNTELSASADIQGVYPYSPRHALSSPVGTGAGATYALGNAWDDAIDNFSEYTNGKENVIETSANNSLDDINNSFDSFSNRNKARAIGPAAASLDGSGSSNNNAAQSLSSLLIPRQFSAQFANQFSAAASGPSSMMTSASPFVDKTAQRNQSTQSPEADLYHMNKLSLSRDVSQVQSQQDILDCCVKAIISQDSVPFFDSSAPAGADISQQSSICQHIHKITGCYVQILPSQNIVTKSFSVAKISVIGGSLSRILHAMDLLLDFVHSLRDVDPNPKIPVQVDKKKMQQLQQQHHIAQQQEDFFQQQLYHIQQRDQHQHLQSQQQRSISHSQQSHGSMSQSFDMSNHGGFDSSVHGFGASVESDPMLQQQFVPAENNYHNSQKSIPSSKQLSIFSNIGNSSKCTCDCHTCPCCGGGGNKSSDAAAVVYLAEMEDFLKQHFPHVLASFIKASGGGSNSNGVANNGDYSKHGHSYGQGHVKRQISGGSSQQHQMNSQMSRYEQMNNANFSNHQHLSSPRYVNGNGSGSSPFDPEGSSNGNTAAGGGAPTRRQSHHLRQLSSQHQHQPQSPGADMYGGGTMYQDGMNSYMTDGDSAAYTDHLNQGQSPAASLMFLGQQSLGHHSSNRELRISGTSLVSESGFSSAKRQQQQQQQSPNYTQYPAHSSAMGINDLGTSVDSSSIDYLSEYPGFGELELDFDESSTTLGTQQQQQPQSHGGGLKGTDHEYDFFFHK